MTGVFELIAKVVGRGDVVDQLKLVKARPFVAAKDTSD